MWFRGVRAGYVRREPLCVLLDEEQPQPVLRCKRARVRLDRLPLGARDRTLGVVRLYQLILPRYVHRHGAAAEPHGLEEMRLERQILFLRVAERSVAKTARQQIAPQIRICLEI